MPPAATIQLPASGAVHPPPYNLDDALPPLQLQMFGNRSFNDCVIAARAHHTIRLVWQRDHSLLPISETDVTDQYQRETGGPDNGLDLETSLLSWKRDGWPIKPSPAHRKIADYDGRYRLQGGAWPEPDPTKRLAQVDLQNRIFSDTGVQISLVLPEGIQVTDDSTFGPGHLWNDTSGSQGDHHVILLIGYTATGFIGITWAQRQEMTWGFLLSHCTGVFVIDAGPLT
jgi:hypothetical protein